MAKQAVAPAPAVTETLEQLLSTKAVSSGKRDIAAEFERVARENGHKVTYSQAKAITPASPSDACFYFRSKLGKATTHRVKGGETFWTIDRLSTGEYAYPSAVKQLVEQLQQQK
jgi:hypothetical protein